jgi:hypothetical protein
LDKQLSSILATTANRPLTKPTNGDGSPVCRLMDQVPNAPDHYAPDRE